MKFSEYNKVLFPVIDLVWKILKINFLLHLIL